MLQDIQNESNKSDFTNLLSEVEEHYSKLISHIKTQKDVITSTIIKVKTAEIESLLKIRDNIENGIKKTKQFSNIVDNIDHSQIEKVLLFSSTLLKLFSQFSLKYIFPCKVCETSGA